MSHEVEQMFSVSQTPWHQLGRVVPDAPSIAEGITLAGLDWRVGTKSLQTIDGEPVGHRATYREDTGALLGVVGPTWTPVQNEEAFSWFQPFVDSGLARLETAGSLREGKRVWVLARIIKDPIVIVPSADDRIERFLLLSNSHDGTMAVRCGFTPIRVVCANTLAMAHGSDASKLLKVKHTRNVVAALDDIRDTMELASASFSATAEQYQRLAAVGVSRADLERYVRRVFAPRQRADDEKAAKRVMDDIVRLFETGAGNDRPGVRGTMWAAYNAATEYLSHERGTDREKRLESVWFGSGAAVNRRALEVALEMAA